MILGNRRKQCQPGCSCCQPKRKIQRFDDTAEPYVVPLEEHFENFADSVVESAESFLGLGKKAQARKQVRQDLRAEKKRAKVEIKKARAEGIKLRNQAKYEQATKPSNLQASQQADQVNQLASQVQPTAQPVNASQTPQGSGDSGGLYKTLPEYSAPTQSGLSGMSSGSTGGDFALEQEQPDEATAKGTEAKVIEEPKRKKSNLVLYLLIGAGVIGAIYFMRKK